MRFSVRDIMRQKATVAALIAAGSLLCLQAAASYPAKRIKMIVPVAAGSALDLAARLIGDPLGAELGSPLVIENRRGAGGVLGTAQLVRSPNDGSTIGMVSSSHVINPSIYATLPFDSLEDVTPISVLGTVPLVLVASPKLAAKGLPQLIALAKSKPGGMNYGSAGTGSALHLAGLLFASEAGIDVRHVPYRDQILLISDLRAGRMDMSFLSITVALGHIRSGAVQPIGVSTPARVALLPKVPSLAEAGLPNYSLDAWIAMIGPAALPKPVVDRLYTETKAILGTPRIQESFAIQGLTVIGSDPESSARFLESELVKHERIARGAGIKGHR